MQEVAIALIKALPWRRRTSLKTLKKLAKMEWDVIKEVLEIPDIVIKNDEGYYKIDFLEGTVDLDNRFNWRWGGDIKEDFLTWVIRLAKSGFVNEISEELGEALTYSQFKALCFIALFNKDGLWAFTGDNAYWYFGEQKGEDIAEAMRWFLEDFKPLLTDEEIEDMIDEAYYEVDSEFETFKRQYWKWFYEMIKDVLKSSKSIGDVFEFFHSEDCFWDVWEVRDEFIHNQAVGALWKVFGRKLKRLRKRLDDIEKMKSLREFMGGDKSG